MKRDQQKVKVIGNCLAALSCLHQLEKSNEISLEWIRFGSNHFEGFSFGDVQIDNGMFLIEPSVSVIRRTIDEFDFNFRNGTNPFVHHFLEWLDALGVSLEPVKVFTLFGTELVHDFYIGDSLEVLGLLPEFRIQRIRKQITELKASSRSHPSQKLSDQLFATSSYSSLVQNILGTEFYEVLIAPLLRKIHPTTHSALLAAEHRIAWLPFHYPESVLKWIDNSENDFVLPKFLYPFRSSFASFVSDLSSQLAEKIQTHVTLGRIADNQDAKIVYFGKPSDLVTFVPRRKLNTDLLQRKFKTVYSEGRIVHLRCEASAPATVFLPDNAHLPFRANIRHAGFGKESVASLEYGEDCIDFDDAHLVRDARSMIERLFGVGAIGSHAIRRVRYPNRIGNRSEAFLAADYARRVLRIEQMTGFPIWEGNNSCNDQMVAGLATAKRLEQ